MAHRDTSRGTFWEAAPNGNYYLMPTRRFISAIASYVPGSHNFKFGAQDTFGFLEQGTTLNGALHQVYQNGAPVQVSLCGQICLKRCGAASLRAANTRDPIRRIGTVSAA